MTSDLDEDSVIFWSSYERSLLAEHQAVVLNRTPVVQNFNLFQRQQCHFCDFETLHWPGLDFADGDVSKSLWSSVWHASPRLWTVTWGFHLTRNTFVKNTFVKIKKYLCHKKKYLCQKKEKSLVKKYVLKKARSPLCHLNRPIFMQQWEFYFKQFFSSFYSSRVGCNFGKLVVALTFHQVDTSCAHRGRLCE